MPDAALKAMARTRPVAGLDAPRFDGANLLNLAATLAAALGHAPGYGLLAEARLREPLLAARHLVNWLIDGLGVEPLQALAPRSALAAAIRGELETVFPSSTAPALTTLATGRSPAAHLAPEWFVWFDELGAIYRSLPLDARQPASGKPPVRDGAALYPQPSLSLGAGRPCFAVLPAAIADSAYTRYAHAGARRLPYADAEGFFGAIEAAIDGSPSGCYVFAYVDAFDQAAHEFGVASEQARAVVQRLDHWFERLSQATAARGALLAVTADHGFIDVPADRRFRLDACADVADCLDRPLCGGPRAPFAYVKAFRHREFPAVVASALGAHFVAVPSGALAAAGWFGPEPPQPRLAARLGTHTLLPTGDAYLVDVLPGEKTSAPIGMHGGLSSAERRVPLILAGAEHPLC